MKKGLFYCLLCGFICICVLIHVPRVATRPQNRYVTVEQLSTRKKVGSSSILAFHKETHFFREK